jgi:hypothetical protein
VLVGASQAARNSASAHMRPIDAARRRSCADPQKEILGKRTLRDAHAEGERGYPYAGAAVGVDPDVMSRVEGRRRTPPSLTPPRA